MPSSVVPHYAVASFPLWVAPSLLALGALAGAVLPKGSARAVSLGAVGASLLALAPSMFEAFAGHHVVSFATRIARVGSLDLPLGFDLDRPAASFAVLVLALATLAVVRPDPSGKRPFAALLVAAGALTAVLSDGLGAWVLGVGVAVAGATFTSTRSWPLVRAKLGTAAVAATAISVAFAYLAWSLGGQWLDSSRYFSDWGARFVIAGEPAAPSTVPALARDPHAVGQLTLVSHPGARVYVGVADELGLARSEPLAVSPFARVDIPAGLQKIVIVPGDAAIIGGDGVEAALIDAVNISPGKETVIELVGSTVTFAEAAAQVEPRKLAQRRLGSGLVATVFVGLVSLGLLFFALFVGNRATAGSTPPGGRHGEEIALDALVATAVAALAYRLASVLQAGEPALLVAGALGVAFAAHVSVDTWLRPHGLSDRARAPLCVSV